MSSDALMRYFKAEARKSTINTPPLKLEDAVASSSVNGTELEDWGNSTTPPDWVDWTSELDDLDGMKSASDSSESTRSSSSDSSMHTDLKQLSESESSDSDDAETTSCDMSDDSDVQLPFMPPRLSIFAPKFDGNPESLERYFMDVEMLCTKCDTDGKSEGEWALQYIEKHEDYEIWRLHSKGHLDDWEEFQDRIMELYPETKKVTYHVLDLHDLAREKREFKSIGDLGNYYRTFLRISETLREEGKLAMDEQALVNLFSRGLEMDGLFRRGKFNNFLIKRTPTGDPKVPYTLSMLFDAACDFLKG